MRPIDADGLFDMLVNTDPNTNGRFCDGIAKALGFILNAPTIEFEPVKRCEDFSNWVDFDKTKPAHMQAVLGIDSEGVMETYYFDEKWDCCLCKYGGNVKAFDITHWMPLPKPPVYAEERGSNDKS